MFYLLNGVSRRVQFRFKRPQIFMQYHKTKTNSDVTTMTNQDNGMCCRELVRTSSWFQFCMSFIGGGGGGAGGQGVKNSVSLSGSVQ